MKTSILSLTGLLLSCMATAQTPCAVSPSSDKNYVVTEVLKKQETVESNINSIIAPDKMTSIQYLDGLGRPLQSIGINASPGLKNVVTFNLYDNAGRENKIYLPYTGSSGCGTYAATPLTAQSSFYTSTPTVEATTAPFSETKFEPSPLNRIIEQGAPGTDWQPASGHTVKYEYGTNTAQEVRVYNMININIFYYAANSLTKKITKDENWVPADVKNGTTEEFTDVEGRMILKRTYTNNQTFDTYYVYDAQGNLTYVVPPEGKNNLVTGFGTAQPTLDKYCYQYGYDNNNRMIQKKMPAKALEYIVYDQLDRPVYTQDGNLRAQNKWLFTKYDAFGRVAYTGLFNSTATRQTLQDQLNQPGPGSVGTLYPLYEKRTATPINIDGKDIYYTNVALPTADIQLLTINYYDNYAFDLDGLTVPTGVYGQPVSTLLTGMPTGTKVRVLEDVLTGYWNTSITSYDGKARPIFTSSQNRYSGFYEQEEFSLNFIGQELEKKTTHIKGTAAPIVTVDKKSYLASGQLFAHSKQINGQVVERIGTNSYNELGQMITKFIGNSTSTSTHLQQVNFLYNIRGWLKQVNDPNNMGTDLFAYTVNFNTTALTGSVKQYNGNISEVSWKTANDNLLRSYNYMYDKLNRITAANSLNTDAGKYSNTGITYDYNGNIKTMTRNGWQNTATYTNMDVLTYVYDGNQLKYVKDDGNVNYGFIDGNAGTATDYTYGDANGNMTADLNKKITSIAYNFLNLPHTINVTQGTANVGIINFAYDANGVKQRKTTTLTGPGIRPNPYIVEYAGGYVYEGNIGVPTDLQYFGQEEGYVKPVSIGSTTFQYVYQYKDHLGNNRLTYTDTDPGTGITLTKVEENNYDAFGLKHQGYNNVISSAGNSRGQMFKYNGKEYQDDYGLNWYDYGARFYDPTIGRWHVPDPLGEMRNWLSPYNYCQDNPINKTDPTGALDEGGDKCVTCPKPQPEANPAGKDNLTGYAPKPPPVPQGQSGGTPKAVVSADNRSPEERQRSADNANYLANGGTGVGILEKAIYKTGQALNAVNSLPATVTLPLMAIAPEMLLTEEGAAAAAETSVYRVFGGASRAEGFSWTPVNPITVSDFRNAAGLPAGNTGTFMIEGSVNTKNIISSRAALPLDGNAGGLTEYIINPSNVNITNFSVIKP